MDLQLGLGISTGSSSSPEEFHSYGYGQMGGGGGFSYSSGGSNDIDNRFLDQTFDGRNGDRQIPQTLPLLVWNENENLGNGIDHEDYDEHLHTETNSLEFNRDANGDVGWPPISYRRKRMCTQNRGGGERNMDWVAVDNGGGGGENGGRGRNSLFVKVNMVGEGIGRKVDLSLHHSVHSLIQSLLAMFGKFEESVHSYKLAYQDEDGYWQLAEDDSWGALIGNVCRLRLLRNNYYPAASTTTFLA